MQRTRLQLKIGSYVFCFSNFLLPSNNDGTGKEADPTDDEVQVLISLKAS